jgi:hypothetical protein
MSIYLREADYDGPVAFAPKALPALLSQVLELSRSGVATVENALAGYGASQGTITNAVREGCGHSQPRTPA